jgi:hypothetical protein
MIPFTTFPLNPASIVYVLHIALYTNGDSSYRDARNMSTICKQKWGAHITVITDKPDRVTADTILPATSICSDIKKFVTALPKNANLLFVISGHGYSTVLSHRSHLELNGRSEYIKSSTGSVYDYQLYDALYSDMDASVHSMCLIDTCHSGTMLDLENVSFDGGIVFQRSRVPSRSRPNSICISACSDNEMAGEDISEFGGWGGKLICTFLDYLENMHLIHISTYFRQLYTTFSNQRLQCTRPVLSYND